MEDSDMSKLYESWGAEPMSLPWIFVVAVYLVSTALLFLVIIFIAWPGVEHWFLVIPEQRLVEFNEVRFLAISAASAGLASVVVSLVSFTSYAGSRRLIKSWGLFYMVNPLIGLATGLFVYMAVRGGILKADVGAGNLNPYAIAVISAIGGFWSRDILHKLKHFAEERLGHEPKGTDA